MNEEPKKLPWAAKDSVKEATIAKYSALYSNLLVNIKQQNSVLGWLVGLIGAVMGVLITVEVPDCHRTIIFAIGSGNKNAFFLLAVLSGAFFFAVELLIIYWIYQLYQISRVHCFINQMEERLIIYLGLPDCTVLFRRESESTLMEDARIYATTKMSRWIIVLYGYMQSAPLYFMALLGWFAFVFSIYNLTTCLLTILGGLVLLGSLVFLGFMHTHVKKMERLSWGVKKHI
jgi:hypothetical protein